MQEALGQHVFGAFGKYQNKANWELYEALMEQILAGEIPEFTFEHQLVEGKGRWCRTRLTPFTEAEIPEYQSKRNNSIPTIQGLIGISMDSTEAKGSDQALKSQAIKNMRLLAAEHAAKVASRLKSQFVTNMSHELRTPISGVNHWHGGFLLDTDVNDERRERASSIQRFAKEILTVINDILDLFRVEAGKLDIEEVPFSPMIVVQGVCNMLSYAADKTYIDSLETTIQA